MLRQAEQCGGGSTGSTEQQGAPTPAGDRAVHIRADPPEGTSLIVPSGPPGIAQFDLSPDGRSLAFVATSKDGRQLLYTRRLDGEIPRVLAGTDGALFPFWAPDNRTLGFFTATELKTVDDSGQVPRVVGPFVDARGGAWVSQDEIIVAGGATGGIYRVRASGGRFETLAVPDSPSKRLVWPIVVPGQRWLLVSEIDLKAALRQAKVTVRSLDGKAERLLLEADARPTFASPDTLLIVRSGILFAQDFDPVSATISGEPRRLIEGVHATIPTGSAALAASGAGDLAYAPSSLVRSSRLTWWSRSGQRGEPLGAEGDYASPDLSPDGRFLAVRRSLVAPDAVVQTTQLGGGADLFILDVERGATTRVTFDSPLDSSPIWHPNGRALAFSSMREGLDDLWVKPVGAEGQDRKVLDGPVIPSDWSSDGRTLIYHSGGPGWQFDLGAVSATPPHRPLKLTDTPFLEVQARLSPDGRWLAYASNESGVFEVYVQPFPFDGRRYPLSIGGGSEPLWRGDGREIFYLAPDGTLMSVGVILAAQFTAQKPTPLFRLDVPPLSLPFRSRYAVTRDGQRVLALTRHDGTPPAIHVLVHWRLLGR